MWADKIPQLWIDKTLEHIGEYSCNNYYIQSKNPIRIYENRNNLPAIPFWIGTTIESNRDSSVLYPSAVSRASAMTYLCADFNTFITIEPIMDFDLEMFTTIIFNCHPKFVNIGADSGNNHLPEPPKEKILKLIDGLREFSTVNIKNNLGRLLK